MPLIAVYFMGKTEDSSASKLNYHNWAKRHRNHGRKHLFAWSLVVTPPLRTAPPVTQRVCPPPPPPLPNLIWGLPCELQGQLSVRDLCRDLEVMWCIHLLYLRRVSVT